MKYTHFLATCEKDDFRKSVLVMYRRVEAFFGSLGFTMTVKTVEEGEAVYDDEKKLIKIPVSEDDKGAIFHEATHDLFHHSVFHSDYHPDNGCAGDEKDANRNESWGQGFCDAVRYLMESRYLPQSSWLVSFDNEVENYWEKQRAVRILDWAGRNLHSFAAGWKRLVADYDMTGDFLNRTIPSTAN